MIGRLAIAIMDDSITITETALQVESSMMPKAKPVSLKAIQTIGGPITNAHFAMLEMEALEGLGVLMREAPKAAELIVTLISRMAPCSPAAKPCASCWAARCLPWIVPYAR